MKQLRDSRITPPGGWRFVDPDTGYKFERRYRNEEELFQHVHRYRAQNRLQPITQIKLVVEQWLCSQPNLERYCREMYPVRTPDHYKRAAVALIKGVTTRRRDRLVSQAVAEKRAAICVNCKENLENPKHTRLGAYTDQRVQALVGSRKTQFDAKLFSCQICTCPLRSKVHFGQHLVEAGLSDTERMLLPAGISGLDGSPLYCWQTHP